MSSIGHSSFSLVGLLDRAIEALAQADTVSLNEVLADCRRAEVPGLAEEFSRALTRQAAFEKVIRLTEWNLRLLRNQKSSFRYDRNRGGVS